MEKFLDGLALLIMIFGVLIGIGYILAGMNSYEEYLGTGFSILLGSLITFVFLSGISEIITMLKEINKKLSDKGWWVWKN